MTTEKQPNHPGSIATNTARLVENKVNRDVPARFHGLEPAKAFPEGDGFFFSGKPGSGKTHKAVQLYHRFMLDRGRNCCYFFRAEDLIHALREDQDEKKRPSYKNKEGATVIAPPLIERLLRARLLVIDDFSDDGLTEWAIAKFNHIINSRYDNLLPTIITTNLTMEDLEGVSKRMSSRMKDFIRVEIKGEAHEQSQKA